MASLIVGVLVGALYDLFRIGRVVFGGGRLKLFFEDVLFSVMSALVFAVFTFNATMGVIRMFAAFGALLGFFAYRFSLGLFTVSLTKAVKALVRPYVVKAKTLVKRRIKAFCSLCYTRRQTQRVYRLAGKGFVQF